MTTKLLCQAVHNDDFDRVKKIVSKNQDVINGTAEWFGVSRAATYLGPMTPLGIAAAYGRYDILIYLVDNGANINGLSGRDNNYTALDCVSAYSQNAEITDYLLCNGARSSEKDGDMVLGTKLFLKGVKNGLSEVAQEFANELLKEIKQQLLEQGESFFQQRLTY